MKILLISYYFDPCAAIGARRWSILSKALKDEGVVLTVLTANWIGEKTRDVEYLGQHLIYKPSRSIVSENNTWKKIQHPSEYFRSISYDVFKSPNWINTCLYWFKENKNKKFDLIITSFSPITNVLAANKALKYWPNAKLVVDHRDLISLQGQKIRIPVIHPP